MEDRGNQAGARIGVEAINREACRLAKEVEILNIEYLIPNICKS